MMVPTPNIDRIAREGMLFTDHYAQPTCTPGRAAFITGQLPIRTGLTTVGMAGSPIGLDRRDPTLAEVLKPLGYRTGQFGKNHLGDRNEHLPTVHGFDEFFGNLYHLNTEEEPELPEWPKDAGFDRRYRPRGVLDAVATDVDDPTEDPRFGRVGRQRIKDTGPLTRARMETVDEEFLARTKSFIRESVKSGQALLRLAQPEPHARLHAPRARVAPPRDAVLLARLRRLRQRPDGARRDVGDLLSLLDELGVGRQHDRPLHHGQRLDVGVVAGRRGDALPGREGHDVGGRRARAHARPVAGPHQGRLGLERHPGAPGPLHHAGRGGRRPGRRRAACKQTHKVQIDGVNNLAHWTAGAPSARNVVYYYNEAELTAIRIGPWKSHFKVRDGFFDYNRPSSLLFNLRMDPFEQHGDQKADDIAMRLGVAWGGQVQDALGAHLKSLAGVPAPAEGRLAAARQLETRWR